ncbi:MAG: hypothetical protein ACREKM_01105, partial [Longimicrobiales bacterium]
SVAWALLLTSTLTGGVQAQHRAEEEAASGAEADAGVEAGARVVAERRAEAEAFVAATRAGIARFHDRSAAIAAGYRRLGPSFPGMGEHWIHPGLIVRGAISPASPAVLCYADIDGRPRLVGAAHAFPLARDAPLPPLPGGSAVWHVHDGAVDEEALLLIHRDAGRGSSGTRLVMTHVWSELENADGVFAQNNWALPFLQAGLSLAGAPDMRAAQALSLLTAGPEYYQELFAAIAQPDAAEQLAIAQALTRTRSRVHAWHTARTGAVGAPGAAGVDRNTAVSAAELAVLAGFWTDLWEQLERNLSSATAASLRAYRGGEHDRHR